MRFRGSPWFAAAALAVLLGLVIQVAVSAGNEEGLFPTAAGRLFNVFCYFTVQSNIVVGLTSALLFVHPQRDNETFRVLRLAGLAAIVVTFVIYHTALSHLVDLDGWTKLADQLLHTLVPVLAVVGWVVAGPRGQAEKRTAWLALLPPAAWVMFTLVRGELIDFYPYPFVDVEQYGYPRVALNIAGVGVLFFALTRGAVVLDRRLGGELSPPAPC
jgi:hypothetical protein